MARTKTGTGLPEPKPTPVVLRPVEPPPPVTPPEKVLISTFREAFRALAVKKFTFRERAELRAALHQAVETYLLKKLVEK